MKASIPIIALALLSLSGNRAIASSEMDSLCFGARPGDDAPLAQAYYDRSCSGYFAGLDAARQTLADEARSKTEDSELDRRLELLGNAADKLKPSNPQAPDVTGFTTAAQRHVADLGYEAGRAAYTRLFGGTSPIARIENPARVLLVSGPDVAAQWLPGALPEEITPQLEAVAKSANAAAQVSACNKEGASAVYSFESGIGAAYGLNALVNAGMTVAQLFQPQILKSASAAAPEKLPIAVLAGFMTAAGGKIDVAASPPSIRAANPVQTAATSAAKGVEAASAKLAELTKNFKEHDKPDATCIKSLVTPLKMATAELKRLTSGDGGSAGSLVDQASREQARRTAGITHLLEIDVVAAGGAVSAYQRNRFSAVKLVTGSDVAMVFQWFAIDQNRRVTTYVSLSCGRAISMGEFAESYVGSCVPEP